MNVTKLNNSTLDNYKNIMIFDLIKKKLIIDYF